MAVFSPGIEREVYEAGYSLRPVNGRQKRFLGRSALAPSIDLTALRLSAGIDTIDVECATGFRGARRHLRNRISSDTQCLGVFVRRKSEAIGPGSIVVRIQNPSYKDLLDLQSLSYLQGQFKIREIHIAVDLDVPRSTERGADLRRLVRLVARHIYPGDANLKSMRWSQGRRRTFHLWKQLEYSPRDCVPFDEGTTYIGHKWDDRNLRIYLKTKDRMIGRRAVTLAESEWRVRVELVLRGGSLEEIGLVSVGSLRRFKFEYLSRCFAFGLPLVRSELPTSKLATLVAMRFADSVATRQLRCGVLFAEEAYPERRRIAHRATLKFWTLNKRFHRALVELTKKVARGRGATKSHEA
jgi:hypothetical protein